MKKEFSKKIKPIVDRIVSENDKFEITKIGGIRKCTVERDKGMFFQAYRIEYKFTYPFVWPSYIEWSEDEVGESIPMSYTKLLEVVFDENFENVKFHLYSEERYREEKTIWELGVRDRSTCEEIKNELDICASHIEKILENGRILEDLYNEFDIEFGYECECDNIVEDLGDGDFLIIDGEKILIRHYSNRQNFVVTMMGKLLSESAKSNFFGNGQEQIVIEKNNF